MFTYRKNEINLLEEDFNKPSSSLTFIFGRRKVGKTFLINEYIKNKQALYLTAFETMPSLLINKLKESIDDFFNIKNLEKLESLEKLINYLSKIKIDEKIIIVLENIQELLKIDKTFLIKFSNYWNNYLQKMNIQFIITSAVLPNNFDNLKIAKKVNNVIKLKSLNFNIIKQLYPELNQEDTMYVYSAFGTNPRYLSLYNTQKDFLQNIENTFLNFDSFLYSEGMNIVKKDLGDAITYCSILYAISMGNNKIGNIANFLNLKSSYLTRYMQKLVDLMIVDKTIPINDNPSKSKFGRYEIEDNFLRFWFRYVYINMNNINSNNSNKLLKYLSEDFNENFLSITYKKYVIEVLEEKFESLFDYTPKKTGSWWNNKDLEIDFIAYDSKTITFIDCKWKKDNNIEDDYNDLKTKAKNFDTQLERKYIIFTGK